MSAFSSTLRISSSRQRKPQTKFVELIGAAHERVDDAVRSLALAASEWHLERVCRGLLLMLERSGEITLPPVKYVRHNPGELCELGPLDFQLVRRTGYEPLFNSLLEHHHYLCYEQPTSTARVASHSREAST
jgi:hypothetical protein